MVGYYYWGYMVGYYYWGYMVGFSVGRGSEGILINDIYKMMSCVKFGQYNRDIRVITNRQK